MYSFSPSPMLRFGYIFQWLISEHWGGHNVTSVTTNVTRSQRESAEIRHAALRIWMKKFSSGLPFPVTFLKLEQGEFCWIWIKTKTWQYFKHVWKISLFYVPLKSLKRTRIRLVSYPGSSQNTALHVVFTSKVTNQHYLSLSITFSLCQSYFNG